MKGLKTKKKRNALPAGAEGSGQTSQAVGSARKGRHAAGAISNGTDVRYGTDVLPRGRAPMCTDQVLDKSRSGEQKALAAQMVNEPSWVVSST